MTIEHEIRQILAAAKPSNDNVQTPRVEVTPKGEIVIRLRIAGLTTAGQLAGMTKPSLLPRVQPQVRRLPSINGAPVDEFVAELDSFKPRGRTYERITLDPPRRRRAQVDHANRREP
jgi:hypothetical protein